MIIKIERGKPVNKVIEIDTDRVIHSEVVKGSGGRVEMVDGEWYAFNSEEWAQWVSGNAWVDEVVDVEPTHHKKGSIFVEQVRDSGGKFKKGKKL
jgi:hypothetical protein